MDKKDVPRVKEMVAEIIPEWSYGDELSDTGRDINPKVAEHFVRIMQEKGICKAKGEYNYSYENGRLIETVKKEGN